jgi:hypothetical protein
LIAQQEEIPSIERFSLKLQEFVQEYYPSVIFEVKDGSKLIFHYNTRKFFIHLKTKNGKWQDAFEVDGPNKDGIYCEIQLLPDSLLPSPAVNNVDEDGIPYPHNQIIYFYNYFLQSYSEKCDCYIEVVLRCYQNSPDVFIKGFFKLIYEFYDYL